MIALRAIGRFAVDACIIFAAAFIALTAYTLYAENPVIVNAIYCQSHTSTDLGYEACMIAHN